jgi:hypothetical protein
MHGSETGFNIPKAFPVGKLSKCHAQELIPAGEFINFIIAFVLCKTFGKFILGYIRNDLGKYQSAGMHYNSPFLSQRAM